MSQNVHLAYFTSGGNVDRKTKSTLVMFKETEVNYKKKKKKKTTPNSRCHTSMNDKSAYVND